MKLLRIPDVLASTGLSRMTIYRLERAGEFPTRRRLGRNSVAWLEKDVVAWIESRPVAARLSPSSNSGCEATDIARPPRPSLLRPTSCGRVGVKSRLANREGAERCLTPRKPTAEDGHFPPLAKLKSLPVCCRWLPR